MKKERIELALLLPTVVDAAASDPESLATENRVFAGTINQSGSIEIQVTKSASENTFAREQEGKIDGF